MKIWIFRKNNFEKFTRQKWEDNLGKVVISHLKIDTWMLKRGIHPSIGLLFSNPSTADVFHINRSVLMAGILNKVLFMVVWRIYSLYPHIALPYEYMYFILTDYAHFFYQNTDCLLLNMIWMWPRLLFVWKSFHH